MTQTIELFSGAGGLALGLHQIGAQHRLLAELDVRACDTIRANNQNGALNPPWPILQADVRELDFTGWQDRIDLLAAGAPCQPFSLGGLHKGADDKRNLLPEVVRAVRDIRPRAFILENVPGLLRPTFAEYFEYLLSQLQVPEVERRVAETWHEHKTRLDWHLARKRDGLAYDVDYKVLAAADYGVPQSRRRLFVVGFRTDLRVSWSWPRPTHSEDALAFAKWVDGSYWRDHGIDPRHASAKFTKLGSATPCDGKPLALRWQTVRDAISSLPPPSNGSNPASIPNHQFVPGARRYKGHSGSSLDDPAKTLKAGVHGVPGGEGTVVQDDGSVRYFSIREAARIQTFPDNYVFVGARSHAMRQIGNAVPVRLASTIGVQVIRAMRGY